MTARLRARQQRIAKTAGPWTRADYAEPEQQAIDRAWVKASGWDYAAWLRRANAKGHKREESER